MIKDEFKEIQFLTTGDFNITTDKHMEHSESDTQMIIFWRH